MEHIDFSQGINGTCLEKKSSGDESDQACFMVQGIDSLEVKSDIQLDDNASSSCDDNAMNAHALNEELSLFLKTCSLSTKL